MERNIVVAEAVGRFIEEYPVEIVERKGIGHPDSLCDGIAERISVEYTRWCQENLGTVLHHNFDKVQLVAGEVQVGFGKGELLKPIHIQIAGRGTPEYRGRMIPMDAIAINAAKLHIRETMKNLDPDKHMVIDCFAGAGAVELAHTVDHIRANDTSFGCAHWPRSQVENAVFETAQFLNYELIKKFPVGEDIKVMGMRKADQIILTCAVPFISTEIQDLGEYIEARKGVHNSLQTYAEKLAPGRALTVDVNTADDDASGEVYLTMTGTSAECGDDGSVGRGNRVTGLITPFRTASLEAAAGKNPISHVGKIYNVLSFLAAQEIVREVPEIHEASVYILSQIGHPLDQPLIATATIKPAKGAMTKELEAKVRAVLDRRLEKVHEIRVLMAEQKVNLY
ncbi:MAG: methionine adenosyltransferase [Anaerolineales bacterium]|nr:methionine adenosyltransferase [Anaerolineales bacterium]